MFNVYDIYLPVVRVTQLEINLSSIRRAFKRFHKYLRNSGSDFSRFNGAKVIGVLYLFDVNFHICLVSNVFESEIPATLPIAKGTK